MKILKGDDGLYVKDSEENLYGPFKNKSTAYNFIRSNIEIYA